VKYAAHFEPDLDDGGFVVTLPGLPGVTQGENLEEAESMAADLILSIFMFCIEEEKDLPQPGKHRGKHIRQITIPALYAMKAELYTAFRKSGIRKAELARRMGISKTNIDRLFDMNHKSRVDLLESAFRALGKELTITVRNAA
jgi:antitoxin HicB